MHVIIHHYNKHVLALAVLSFGIMIKNIFKIQLQSVILYVCFSSKNKNESIKVY